MLKTLRSVVVSAVVLTMPVLSAAQDKAPRDQAPQQQGAQPSDAAPQQHQAISGTPDLTVATVKAQSGHRASKIVGAAVYNGGNQQVGTIDDIILDDDGKAVLAIIAVGGFLGVGSKLVAEPYSALKFDGSGKVVLPDASKDSLNGMPAFTYG